MAKGKAYEISTPVKTAVVKPAARNDTDGASAAIEIVSVGLPVLFQDLGRSGQASQGISTSGAADRGGLRAANRLVGNATAAAALEISFGADFKMRGRGVMAVTGAPAAITIIGADGVTIAALHNETNPSHLMTAMWWRLSHRPPACGPI